MESVETDIVIGRNVHHIMWEKRVSHRAIYEALGVTRGSLAKKMRGDVAWFARDVLVVAKVLGVSPCDLYEEGGLPRQDSNLEPFDLPTGAESAPEDSLAGVA